MEECVATPPLPKYTGSRFADKPGRSSDYCVYGSVTPLGYVRLLCTHGFDTTQDRITGAEAPGRSYNVHLGY